MPNNESGTLKRSKIVCAIQDFTRDNGYPPTIRDIANLADIKSTSTVQYHLNVLRSLGVVTWETGRGRTIRLARK